MEALVLSRRQKMVSAEFWSGKRVLVTGHTGFKGTWLCIWLRELGALVSGFALKPTSSPALYDLAKVGETISSHIGDIRSESAVRQVIRAEEPEIVIHMAAQPLVQASYADPITTYATNVMGTVHVLEAVRDVQSVKAVINVTSDKCYENREWVWAYRESDAMGGYDPYSSSKGCAELVTSAYRRSFLTDAGIALASVRSGNVIGGGDWSAGRIVPDLLRAVETGESVDIRNPRAIRPWQHVLDPLPDISRSVKSCSKIEVATLMLGILAPVKIARFPSKSSLADYSIYWNPRLPGTVHVKPRRTNRNC